MSAIVISAGAAIRAYGGTKDNRPGVVLRRHPIDGVWWVFVAFGTSQPPPVDVEPPPVFVDRSHHAFASLGLDKPTWFTRRGAGRLREDDPSLRHVGTCPPDVLVALRQLFGFT
ncbi:hypothetical protein [Chondromyces apiculatus]|uniref:PemK-like protein n=1 Tax=Chondromyces apiculatus DSM 436 TaxID=1192034 RepID=A0A017T1G0_9BACT|nr:hypothetical protein [Chondromyces apiculatus]EYF02685.1 Hypothetical protein CAP_6575 [Chondromyces apiculatus DSM 436]